MPPVPATRPGLGPWLLEDSWPQLSRGLSGTCPWLKAVIPASPQLRTCCPGPLQVAGLSGQPLLPAGPSAGASRLQSPLGPSESLRLHITRGSSSQTLPSLPGHSLRRQVARSET